MDTLFRTLPLYLNQDSKIDKENGIITDIAVITMGEAKGHDVWIDETFLNQLVDNGNSFKQGSKSRFGHPAMSSTALGTFLGRFTNFYKKNDKVFADLQLSETAKNTPNGNLYDYILNLAEKEPDIFGTSIVFKRDINLEEKDNKDSGKKYFARLSQLHGVDIVDSPAANPNGLFSEFSDSTFAGTVSNFLDNNPQIFELLNKKPDIINGFLKRYNTYKETQMNETQKTDDGLDAQLSAIKELLAQEQLKVKELSESKSAIETKLGTLKKTNNEFKVKLQKINKEFGSEILGACLDEDLSFEQAKDLYIANLKLKNDSLQKTIKDKSKGTDGVPFSEAEDTLSEDEKKFKTTQDRYKDVVGEKLSAYAASLELQLKKTGVK